jgi:hypothetical protein
MKYHLCSIAAAMALMTAPLSAADLKTHKECLTAVEDVSDKFEKANATKQPPEQLLKNLETLSKKAIDQCSGGDFAGATATYAKLREAAGLPK